MNIETANRLLQYRKKHNLSQEELAAKIGVSRQAISKWERAEASPDTDNLILLAEIYGVSLDELLKGETSGKSKNDDCTEPDADSQTKNTYNNACQPNDEKNETKYKKVDKVSFKNGLHVDSKDGDHVHLSFKNGIHVHDKHGTNVDIDGNGVFVNENGKQRVYTDENGYIMADEDVIKCHNCKHNKSVWNKFPFFILAMIAFVCWGVSGVCFGWALSWIVLLTIPLYYTLVDAIFERKASHFAYPVLAVIAYILFGYFNICGGWAYGWIVFLTIPIYYWICSLFNDDDDDDNDDDD